MQVLDTVSGLTAKALPAAPATAPAQIVATSTAVSGDGTIIFGNTDTFHYRYDSNRKILRAGNYTSSPDARTTRRQRESRRHTLDLGLDIERSRTSMSSPSSRTLPEH